MISFEAENQPSLRAGQFCLGVLAILLLVVSNTAVAQDISNLPSPVLEKEAHDGNPDAQFQFAEQLRKGTSMPQDLVSAAYWYRKAAAQGHAGAQNSLAGLLAEGLEGTKGYAEALKWFAKAAEQNDPDHVTDLALAYETGVGTAPDDAQAAKLYERASEMGSQRATVSLAVLLMEGRGVEADPARAAELLQRPAASGNARAQNNLGLLYVRGHGVEKDYNRAAELFQAASDAGLRIAMSNLGVMYENGFGVEQSDETATFWYRRSAGEDGMESSALYFDPRLLPVSPSDIDRYLVSAHQGDPIAQFLVGYTMAEYTSAADAAKWLQKAANSGLASAMAGLGQLHMQGRGVLQDFETGYMWLSLAAASGLPDLEILRDAAARKLTKDQISRANARAKIRWQDQTGGD